MSRGLKCSPANVSDSKSPWRTEFRWQGMGPVRSHNRRDTYPFPVRQVLASFQPRLLSASRTPHTASTPPLSWYSSHPSSHSLEKMLCFLILSILFLLCPFCFVISSPSVFLPSVLLVFLPCFHALSLSLLPGGYKTFPVTCSCAAIKLPGSPQSAFPRYKFTRAAMQMFLPSQALPWTLLL